MTVNWTSRCTTSRRRPHADHPPGVIHRLWVPCERFLHHGQNRDAREAARRLTLVGAPPSLPHRQGFGRREILCVALSSLPPESPTSTDFQADLSRASSPKSEVPEAARAPAYLCEPSWCGLRTNRALAPPCARRRSRGAGVLNSKSSDHQIALSGLAGRRIKRRTSRLGVRFIAVLGLSTRNRVVRRLDYDADGRLLITKCTHEPVSKDVCDSRKGRHSPRRPQLTTNLGGILPLGDSVTEVSICCHSNTPARRIPHLDLRHYRREKAN
ncbi:hypothetical protein C8J57DRAFT_192331 [Mycena rebaudengoi]|nr:hypothetical protein C8J57DRAFT_192331 [Mycena rebaudengoi]